MLCSSLAFGQYEEVAEPYIEGFVDINGTLPMGYLKNDLIVSGANLNAKAGVGLDVGAGYYLTKSLIAGLYFSARNMGVEDDALDFHDRVFEVGIYGKYNLMNIAEKSWTPYIRATVGLNFSKLATRVRDLNNYVYRELGYDPSLGTGIGAGAHFKFNARGGVYVEGSYHMDMMDGVGGEFKGVEYNWGDNNQYVVIGAGVLFNIGPKE